MPPIFDSEVSFRVFPFCGHSDLNLTSVLRQFLLFFFPFHFLPINNSVKPSKEPKLLFLAALFFMCKFQLFVVVADRFRAPRNQSHRRDEDNLRDSRRSPT